MPMLPAQVKLVRHSGATLSKPNAFRLRFPISPITRAWTRSSDTKWFTVQPSGVFGMTVLHAVEHVSGVDVLVPLCRAVIDDHAVHDRLQHLRCIDIFGVDREQVPVEDDHVG